MNLLILLYSFMFGTLLQALPLVADPDKGIQTKNDMSMVNMVFRIKTLLSGETVTPQKEMFVLGTGLSRTGTKSTKAALEYLGYKAFHMEDVLDLGMGWDVANAMHSDASLKKLVNKLLSLGYNATLDFPMNGLVGKMLKLFPNAKVIHTNRDSPEIWAKSYNNIFIKFRFVFGRPLKWANNLGWMHPGGTDYANNYTVDFIPCRPHERPWLQMLPWVDCVSVDFHPDLPTIYRNWEERVRREFGHLGKDQFIIFNAKQGWKPIADLLGIPVPPVPFPHINEAANLDVAERITTIVGVIWPFVLGLLILFHLWVCEKVLNGLRKLWRMFSVYRASLQNTKAKPE